MQKAQPRYHDLFPHRSWERGCKKTCVLCFTRSHVLARIVARNIWSFNSFKSRPKGQNKHGGSQPEAETPCSLNSACVHYDFIIILRKSDYIIKSSEHHAKSGRRLWLLVSLVFFRRSCFFQTIIPKQAIAYLFSDLTRTYFIYKENLL